MAVLDFGYVYVERGEANAFQLGCDKWFLNQIWEIRETARDTAGDQHQGFDQQIIGREIILKNVWFRDSADAEAFLARSLAFNAAGNVTIEVRKTSAALPGSLFAFKAGVTSLEMLFEVITNLQKMGRGDDDTYMISQIKLRQTG